MNIGTIVRLMDRGQITIPKAYRDKLGMRPAMPLNVIIQDDRIVVQPFVRNVAAASGHVMKAKYTREQYMKVIKRIAKSKVVLWTDEDDKAREAMRKKEKMWDW